MYYFLMVSPEVSSRDYNKIKDVKLFLVRKR